MGGRGGSLGASATYRFKTVKEAGDAIWDTGLFKKYARMTDWDMFSPDPVGDERIDVHAANDMYDAITEVLDKFPELKGIVNSIEPKELDHSTYAAYSPGSGKIYFNPYFFEDYPLLEGSYLYGLETGYSPKGTDSSAVIAHEIGHAVEDYLTRNVAFGWDSKTGWPKDAAEAMQPRVLKNTKTRKSDIGKEVSGYAETDVHEWFAESFSEYTMSDNPRKSAQSFGRVLKRALKKIE